MSNPVGRTDNAKITEYSILKDPPSILYIAVTTKLLVMVHTHETMYSPKNPNESFMFRTVRICSILYRKLRTMQLKPIPYIKHKMNQHLWGAANCSLALHQKFCTFLASSNLLRVRTIPHIKRIVLKMMASTSKYRPIRLRPAILTRMGQSQPYNLERLAG